MTKPTPPIICAALCLSLLLAPLNASAAGDGLRFGIGLGYANASVHPNTDNAFYDGGGLSLGFGLALERPLTDTFALTARADLLTSITYSVTAGADASLGAMASVGFVLGETQQPGQLYLSATVGPGAAVLTDRGLDESGKRDCLLCTSKKGGSSGGFSGRLAIGRAGQSGSRIELVLMSVGGNGNDNDYGNGEDAYLRTIMLQISGQSH